MAFQRMDGFAGSIPQKFADNQIPVCPCCGSSNPHWAIDKESGKFMSLNPDENAHKFLYRCEQCGGILKIPATDIAGTGRSSLLSWQGLAKKMDGRTVSAIYVTVVTTGNRLKSALATGQVITLDELNVLAASIK